MLAEPHDFDREPIFVGTKIAFLSKGTTMTRNELMRSRLEREEVVSGAELLRGRLDRNLKTVTEVSGQLFHRMEGSYDVP